MRKTIALAFAICFLFSSALNAQKWWKNRISGEGPKVTKDLNVDNFTSFRLAIGGDVYLTQGNTQSVKVVGQENIIANIVTDVEGKTWKIKFDRPVRRHEGIKIYITMPSFENIGISGSGNVVSENKFTNLGDIALGVSGSGDFDLDLDARNIDSKVSGSGNIKLSGSTGKFGVKVSGSGDIHAYNLTAQSCSVRISGSGDCRVDVQEELSVSISGSGDVVYEGRPKVRSKISGSGDVESRD